MREQNSDRPRAETQQKGDRIWYRLWVWGDAFMGEVVDNRRDSVTDPLIYGNLFVELDGYRARTICGGTPQQPRAVVESDSVDGKQAVYWPHHGFVSNDVLHLYLIRIVFDPAVWFYPHSLAYVRMRLPDYELLDKCDVASYPVNGIWYGFGWFEREGVLVYVRRYAIARTPHCAGAA